MPDYNPDALRRGTQLFGEEHCRRALDQTSRWDPQFGKLFQDFVKIPFVLQAMRHFDTLREDLEREEREYTPGSER